VHSYLDKRLQVLLNIKLIFNESSFAQKEKGGDIGYAQKIKSLKTRKLVAIDSGSVERIVNEKDAEEELLSDSLEMHKGDEKDFGGENVTDDFKRELAMARRVSGQYGARKSNPDAFNISDHFGASQGHPAPTINELSASIRKNLLKGVTQCNNEFTLSHSGATNSKDDRKRSPSRKKTSKRNKSSVQNSQDHNGPDSFGNQNWIGDSPTPDLSQTHQASNYLSSKFEEELIKMQYPSNELISQEGPYAHYMTGWTGDKDGMIEAEFHDKQESESKISEEDDFEKQLRLAYPDYEAEQLAKAGMMTQDGMNRMMTVHRDGSAASKMPKETAKKQTLYKGLTDGEEASMVDGEKMAKRRTGSANFYQVFILENMSFAFIDGPDNNLIYNMYLNNPDVSTVKQMLKENLPELRKNEANDAPNETDSSIKEQQLESLRNAKKRGSVRVAGQMKSNSGPQEPFKD
jgi:hypothetical protein